MTTDTSTTDTSVESPLEAYKRQVREEALQVQRDMNWPDEKMNETLRALGLPEKVTYRIPVKMRAESVVVVQIDDAMSEDEAREKALAKPFEELRRQVRSDQWRDGTVEFYVRPEGEYSVGDPHDEVTMLHSDQYNRRWCRSTNGSGYECSLERGHTGTQHVASNDVRVVAVWPITEGTPGRRPA